MDDEKKEFLYEKCCEIGEILNGLKMEEAILILETVTTSTLAMIEIMKMGGAHETPPKKD